MWARPRASPCGRSPTRIGRRCAPTTPQPSAPNAAPCSPACTGGSPPPSSSPRARALDGIEGPLFVDLADSKRELRRVLDARGFAAARPFTRMLYGSSARFDDAARTFAVVGPEFG